MERATTACALIAMLAICGGAAAAGLPPTLAPALAQAAAAPGPSKGEDVSLLFIQQAVSGKLVMDEGSSSVGTLMLAGVPRHTVWFTDRPGRSAGQVETSFFAGKNFTDAAGDWLSKPNAALYVSEPGPNVDNDTIIVVTLSDPAYNASAKSLTYRVEVIPGNSSMLAPNSRKQGGLLTSYMKVVDDPLTPTLLNLVEEPVLDFDNVVLFIDNWGWGWGRGRGWWGWRWCSWGGWGWCWGW